MTALGELLASLEALGRLPALELGAVAAALGGEPRVTDGPADRVFGPPTRWWLIEGPSEAFAERRFEIRGAGFDPFVLLDLPLASGTHFSLEDAEPAVGSLPCSFRIDHASFPSGPRITGTSYQFAVPAGTLWLSLADASQARFSGPALGRQYDRALNPRPSGARLTSVVLNNERSKLDPRVTLRSMRRRT